MPDEAALRAGGMTEAAAIDALTRSILAPVEPPRKSATKSAAKAVADSPDEMAAEPEEQDAPPAAEGEESEEAEGSETDTEPEGAEEEAQEDELIEVKVNGRLEKVTAEELLKGYSREADYRQKTSALAEHRRAFEAEQTAARDSWQKRMAAIDQMAEFMAKADPVIAKAQQTDWEKLAEEDPGEYVRLTAAVKKRIDALQSWQAGRAKAMEEELTKHRQTEYGRLIEQVPELADRTTAMKEAKELGEYLSGGIYKFTDQEINSTYDHRLLIIGRKAMLYDRMMASKPLAQKKVSGLPRVIKPAAGRPRSGDSSGVVEARKRFQKSRSPQDAEALLAAQLLGR